MISIVSCKTAIICNELELAKIKPLLLKDLSFQFNRCRVRCFDFNSWVELPMEQCTAPKANEFLESQKVENFDDKGVMTSVDYPALYCDGLGGFSNEDMAKEVKPKIKRLNTMKIDACGK